MVKAAVGSVLGLAFYTNVAIALIALGAVLGTVGFFLWLDNRSNLARLDEFLRDQAVAGTAALANTPKPDDGA